MKIIKEVLNSFKRKYPDLIFVFRFQKLDSVDVSYINGSLDKITQDADEGLGVHVFTKEGFTGFSSTNILNTENIEACTEKAVQNAIFAQENKHEKVPGIKYFSKTVDKIEYKPNIKPNVEEIKSKIQNLYKEILKLHANELDLNININFGFSYKKRNILRSDGTDIEYSYPVSVLSILLTGRKGLAVQDYYISRTGKYMETFDKANLNLLMKEINGVIKLIGKLMHAKRIESGNYDLLLSGKVGGVFIHEAFGHTAEADSINTKSPLAKDGGFLKGKKIAPEYVQVYEQTRKFGRGYTPYCDYGFPRKKVDIVKDGKLNDFLSDIVCYQESPNGYSRSESYSDIPVTRMSNTVLEISGENTFEFKFDPIIDDIDKIYRNLLDNKIVTKEEKLLYLVSSSGGQVSTEEGTFQFNSVATYLLNKGKTELYKGVSFSGKTLSVLSSIESGSKDLEDFPGTCGKNGQHVPEIATAPKILKINKNKEILVA